MAQTYTLEEAAGRIGITPEEFKRRVRTDNDFKQLKSFRDGATLRFRTADIDELARTLGAASDPGLQLGKPTTPPDPVTGDYLLPTDNSDDIPLSLSLDDSDPSGHGLKKKGGSDSDVRLEAAKKTNGSGETGAITEEISLDVAGPASAKIKSGGSSGKLVAPKSGSASSGKVPVPAAPPDMTGDSSSEFELSLDSDSDSFELQLNTDSSEEIDLGSSPTTGTPRAAGSGLSMSKPADSGVSLEKGKKKPPAADDSDSLDFELALEPETPSKPAPKKKAAVDSDSEFELSLEDDSGVTENLAKSLEKDADKGDIFETDFDIPKLDESDSAVVASEEDSGSEVVAIDGADTDLENSDFDLALDEADVVAEDDESASQVVLVEDEDAPEAAHGLVDEEAAAVVVDDEEEELVTAGAQPAVWTAFPVVMLALSLVIVFLGTLIGFEGARSVWASRQSGKTAAPITEGIAGVVGMTPTQQKK
jgi:hypothetical protein